MTRINANIPPIKLIDQHLLAEHYEIVRVCGIFKHRLQSKKLTDLPKVFTLGTNHVLFFADKGLFTLNRYKSIHEECLNRKFDVQDYSVAWDVYKGADKYFQDWKSASLYNHLLFGRIIERIKASSQIPRYYSLNISKEEAFKILTT